MRGQKYGDELKEKAFAMLSINPNVSSVARELGVPFSTLNGWKKEFEKTPKEKKKRDKSLEKVREQKKKAFIDRAWNIIYDAQTLLQRRITTALNKENELDKLIAEISSAEEISEAQRKTIINRLASLRMDEPKQIAIVLGTMYDKASLAEGNPTVNVGGKLDVPKKFEEL